VSAENEPSPTPEATETPEVVIAHLPLVMKSLEAVQKGQSDSALSIKGMELSIPDHIDLASANLASPLMTQNFEGNWPSSGWQVLDTGSLDGGQFLMGKRNCHPYSGGFSGWSIGGGLQGSLLPCSSKYPDNARSWAVYGPFDMSQATSADLRFHIWGRTEPSSYSGQPYDYLLN
jgi:hypothetical protein